MWSGGVGLAAQIERSFRPQEDPAGGRAIHLRLFQQPRQEAMAVAAIGERRHGRLMPEGRIALRLHPRRMLGLGHVELFELRGHSEPPPIETASRRQRGTKRSKPISLDERHLS